ncbi:hypothetical protein A6V36_25985 [Paraburkholderia ginsengiterrae]|uniref:Uncharacterized protein n=1 Tax=Paraburkholderia ginsengiterrae TaxID=1462993 RepID=A0A1A9N6C4_9BURK|nr:hypothetical protein [Paraburkholderia ginsengiterrae]OAJ59735.1 hypothetical protein A6V37_26655 [Paraburkholderia ginsengiterrae]OAJ59823.1 hypothetical protein A6V36_25985 [Paraburkholderia ginsengiterrae]
MTRAILSTALCAVLTMAATAAFAQEAPPPPAAARTHSEAQRDDGPPAFHDRMGPIGPGFAVVNDLEQLRRLYAMSGRESEIIAVYHEVLNKTQDPMLRHYVYDALAREQLKPANPDQAIATLRTSLSEDLAASNKLPHGMPPPSQP